MGRSCEPPGCITLISRSREIAAVELLRPPSSPAVTQPRASGISTTHAALSPSFHLRRAPHPQPPFLPVHRLVTPSPIPRASPLHCASIHRKSSYYKLGGTIHGQVHAEMDPGQQSSSSSSSSAPFSEEETQLFYSIRGSMDETFRLANALGKVGLWEEISRRFEALGHRRSPQELEARFGQYKPKRPRKKRKRAAAQADDQQEPQAQPGSSSSAPPQPAADRREQQAQEERLARSRRVEEARKRLLDEIDLDAFFSEENSWKGAVIALKLGRSESELGE